MTPETQAFFDKALALSEPERARLAELLMESLSPEADGLTDEEWLAKLEQRSADFDRGTAGATPWSELQKEV